MNCKYRLLKIYFPETKESNWWVIRPAFTLFGCVLWWQNTTKEPYDNEEEAMTAIESLCPDDTFYEMREVYKKENLH